LENVEATKKGGANSLCWMPTSRGLSEEQDRAKQQEEKEQRSKLYYQEERYLKKKSYL